MSLYNSTFSHSGEELAAKACLPFDNPAFREAREPHPNLPLLGEGTNRLLIGEGTNRLLIGEGTNRLLIGEGTSRPPNRGRNKPSP